MCASLGKRREGVCVGRCICGSLFRSPHRPRPFLWTGAICLLLPAWAHWGAASSPLASPGLHPHPELNLG